MKITSNWLGKEALARTARAELNGVRLAADALLEKTDARVPILSHDLVDSGGTDDDGNKTAVVYYDTPYAIRQHEDLSYHHRDGRTAKYVEGPLNENRKQLQEIVQRTVNAAL